MNIRELSLGSLVIVEIDGIEHGPCEVVKLNSDTLNALWGDNLLSVNHDKVSGLPITGDVLRHLGFIKSDERAWKLVYYFGDMRLYWKYDKRKHYSTFKFQPDFTQKRWTRIECAYIHSLQNIMMFLTGGELEFFYKSGKEKEYE